MPTYEYECTHCGHQFEQFQKMTDKALEACPTCGKKVRRLIGGGAGVIFKGAGFYATDYRKPSKDGSPPGGAACPKSKEGCGGCPNAS